MVLLYLMMNRAAHLANTLTVNFVGHGPAGRTLSASAPVLLGSCASICASSSSHTKVSKTACSSTEGQYMKPIVAARRGVWTFFTDTLMRTHSLGEHARCPAWTHVQEKLQHGTSDLEFHGEGASFERARQVPCLACALPVESQ